MSDDALAKIAAKTAAEIGGRVPLGEEAQALLGADATPRQFLDLLIERELFSDACRFLAHALPKREAVWWACLCARRVYGASPPPPAAAALDAAELWVADPNDVNRRAAMPAAEAAEIGTPAGAAALGAYFSGGSLAPPELPEVPPGEALTASTVGASVLLAAVLTEPEQAPEKFRGFLGLGMDVAAGKNLWNKSEEAAQQAPAAPKPGGPKPGGPRPVRLKQW